MRSVYVSTILMFGLWLALSGHYTPLLLALGALSALGVSLLAKRMNVLDEEGLPMGILFRLPRVTLWIIWEILKSNLGVIRVIIAPSKGRAPTGHCFSRPAHGGRAGDACQFHHADAWYGFSTGRRRPKRDYRARADARILRCHHGRKHGCQSIVA